jgi:hypothetical protein
MCSAFFEIDPKYVSTNAKDTGKEVDYSQITDSLRNVQESMDAGLKGKDILAQNPDRSVYGVAETYRQFYNPEQRNRVKIDVNADGSLSCDNGNHRCDSAREKGLFIPAEVRCADKQQLADAKQKYGSGRDLSQFDPRAEQVELDREQPPFSRDDFKNKYAGSTPVESTPDANDNNELVNRYTDNGGSIKSSHGGNQQSDGSPIRI